MVTPLLLASSILVTTSIIGVYAAWQYDIILAVIIFSIGIVCVVSTWLITLRAYKHIKNAHAQLAYEMNLRQVAESTMNHHRMEALGRLTAGIAHDFNNMLSVIIGNVEQIAIMTQDQRIKQKVDRVLAATIRGATLAGHMLTFSRRQMLHTERCDLIQEIINIIPLLESSIGSCNKLIIVAHKTSVFCTIDRSEFTLAVTNIANNAAQAMLADGTLTITVASVENYINLPPGQYAMIIMQDTGEGMSDEVCQRAFEPFFTTRDLTIGTGLGLSHVYGFAKQCGGDVTIESKLTEGTKVTLYLPMNEPNTTKPATILVVDDSTELLDILGPTLESSGYIALCTNDPHEALQLIDNHTIAVMLTDMVMPQMSGVELVEHVLAKQPRIKVILMTGYSNQTSTYPILRKPFRLHDLVDQVKQLLGESPGRWT